MHSKNHKRQSSPVPPRTPAVPSVVPSVVPSAVSSAAPEAGPGASLAFKLPKDFPHSRFSKAPLAVYPPKGGRSRSCVSLPVVSLEKMPCLGGAQSASQLRPSSSSSSSPSPRCLKQPSPSAPPGCASAPRSSPSGRPGSAPPPDRAPSPSWAQRSLPSREEKKNHNGTKATSRSHARLSGRVFDPNKHCGVQDPETKRPCTRSLTCKTHSLSQRRVVPGRRTHFDLLLAEHKGRSKEKDQEGDGGGAGAGARERLHSGTDACPPSLPSQEPAFPNRPPCPNGPAASTLSLHLAHTHLPRVPGGGAPPPPSSSFPEAPAPSWPTAAGGAGRPSSDEGDGAEPAADDGAPLGVSSRHPRPAAVCVFSSRLMGHGHFVFDRRWDRMRRALQSMVEKHLNAQMWRKVPLAAESFLPSITSSPSLSPPPPVRHAAAAAPGKARNGTHRAPPQLSLETEDSLVGAKKRKNSSYSSFSASFLSADHRKRNGDGCHPPSQGSAGSGARRKGAGLWSATGGCSTGGNGSLGSSSVSTSSAPQPPEAPSAQRAEGRKRRSPGSYRGRGGTAGAPGGSEGPFGTAADGRGAASGSGPASPTQAALLRRAKPVSRSECGAAVEASAVWDL